MPVSRKRFSTALPKEPVPPVISNVLSVNMLWVFVTTFGEHEIGSARMKSHHAESCRVTKGSSKSVPLFYS